MKNTFTLGNGTEVEINVPHFKYVDRVLRRNCYEEMMWLFMKASAPSKEVSESYAALSNLSKCCDVSSIDWIQIGDGRFSRTSAMFAFMSKSRNISVDPNINTEFIDNWKNKYNVRNLEIVKSKFQDADIELGNNDYGIVCVHSHVSLVEVDKKFPNWKYLLTIPCCMPRAQVFNEEYAANNGIVEIINRKDYGILSPKRNVIVYKKEI